MRFNGRFVEVLFELLRAFGFFMNPKWIHLIGFYAPDAANRKFSSKYHALLVKAFRNP